MASRAFFGPSRAAVLPEYRKQRPVWQNLLRHGSFLGLCVFSGLLYGFMWVLLPPQLFLVYTLPLVLLALIVIWALPDMARAPLNLVARLFFIYLGVSLLWPDYLAFQISGLPWISLRRMFVIPLAILFLISYSISPALRAGLADVFGRARIPLWMMLGFILIQFVTLVWAQNLYHSLNALLKFWSQFTIAFFVAAWVFTSENRVRTFINLLLAAGAVLCVIAGLEFLNRGVIWAEYIPSFLKVDNQALVDRFVTAKIRDGQYRVIGPYPVSLSLAEILALITPFVIHRIMTTRSVLILPLWILFDLALLGAIETTQSRLGTLGWVVAHAAYGCLWAFRRWRRERADILAPAVSLAYPVGVVLFFIGMFTIPAIRNRTIGGGSTGNSDQSRLDQLSQMWPKLADNPFGHGTASSGMVLQYYDPGGLLTVDTYVITMLLDYGVLGFGLFFGLIVYSAVKMMQIAWIAEDKHLELALPIACAFLVMLEVRLVLSQTDNHAVLFVLMALAAAMLARARAQGMKV